jgi:hypothetical protein
VVFEFLIALHCFFLFPTKELEESGGLYSEMKCMQNMALVEWKLEGSV